jgi:hypothetical protein
MVGKYFCSFPSSKCDAPYTNYRLRSHTKYEVLLLARFPSQTCESRRNSKRLSTHTIKYTVFYTASAWDSVKAKTLHQAWGKLWPATRVAEGASDEDDFAGFNV